MGKFNWWRRCKPKAKLQRKDALRGKSFLLQQIEHGDFDYSDYASLIMRGKNPHHLYL